MMLRDFLRYPSVFKKSVRGKMFLFYRNLKLCPRERSHLLRDFLRYPSVFKKSVRGKMLLFYRNLKLCPREGAILWVRKTPVLGHL